MDARIEAEIVACERRLYQAMRTSDVALLDALLHDDLLFNGPSGETARKAQDLANYASGGIQLHTVEPSDLELSVVGGDAVVAVTVLLRGSYLGQALDGKVRYLRVWKRFGDGWKVIAGSVVAPAAGG